MKPKEILVFGATGQIGRHLLRKLAKNNFKLTVVTRNLHRKGYILKSQANAGWINIIEIETFNFEKLNEIFKGKDICINLIGILNEKKKSSFHNIHTELPEMLAQLSKNNNLKQFVHLSALGIENALNSKYAQSKFNGENKIKKTFSNFVILKPSIIYSVDDNFSTMLMRMLKYLPLFPIYFEGKTNFHPLHVSDMTEIIEKVIKEEICSESIECIGPESITFKEILNKIMISLDIKRILMPVPYFIAQLMAKLFEISMRNPLLTSDQLILLQKNNSPTGKYKTNLELNLNSNIKFFDKEILKYSYMWKENGEFSRKKN